MNVLLIRPGTELLYPDPAMVINSLSGRKGIELFQHVLPTTADFRPPDEWSPCHCPSVHHNHLDMGQVLQDLKSRRFGLVIRVPFDNRRYTKKAMALHKMESALPARFKHFLSPFNRFRHHFPPNSFHATHQIVIDLVDRLFLNSEEIRVLGEADLYFKWNQPFDTSKLVRKFGRPDPSHLELLESRLRGIPLGLSDARYHRFRKFRTKEKKYDLFWAGNTGNSHRLRIVREMERISSRHGLKTLILKTPVSPEEFCREAAASKVVLSPEGQGWECWRHIEAFALGSIPLMNAPTAHAPAWERMPRELFFKNGLQDFEEALLRLVKEDTLRDSLLTGCEEIIEKDLLWSRIMDYILVETAAHIPELAPALKSAISEIELGKSGP